MVETKHVPTYVRFRDSWPFRCCTHSSIQSSSTTAQHKCMRQRGVGGVWGVGWGGDVLPDAKAAAQRFWGVPSSAWDGGMRRVAWTRAVQTYTHTHVIVPMMVSTTRGRCRRGGGECGAGNPSRHQVGAGLGAKKRDAQQVPTHTQQSPMLGPGSQPHASPRTHLAVVGPVVLVARGKDRVAPTTLGNCGAEQREGDDSGGKQQGQSFFFAFFPFT
jgi:hypothetical protein